MKINRHNFEFNKTYHLSEDIDFSKETFSFPIKQIPFCHVECDITDYDDILRIKINIKTEVIGICSYSLEDVNLKYDINDELEFTDQEDNSSEDIFYEKDPIFSLDPYILGLIITEVPMKIIKEGKTLPKEINGVRIISEEQYEKEKKSEPDPRWSKLDDIEL